MYEKRKNTMKKDRGFSLVELIIGMAIVSVVGSLVVGFLLFSTKHFGSSSQEANLQENSQILFSQLDNYLIDANGSVCYYVNPQETGDGTEVLSDARYTGTGTDFKSKRLEIYKTSDSGATVETIVWTKSTKKLTYAKAEVDSNGNIQSTIADTQLLAENVTAFSVDLTELEAVSKVSFSVTLMSKEKTYDADSIVTLRNKVGVNSKTVSTTGAVVTPTVLSVRVTPSSVTLRKGESQRFKASVRGDNYPSQDVTWSISGQNSDATTIDANGTLFVAENETASSLQVIATSIVDSSKSGKADVSVKEALTYELVITPDTTTTVKAGKTVDLTAKLVDSDGYEYADADVSWVAAPGSVGTFSNEGTKGHSITYQVADGIANQDISLTASAEKNGITYSKSVTIHVPAGYNFVVQGNLAPSFSGKPQNVVYKGDVVVTDQLLDLDEGIVNLYNALNSSDRKAFYYSVSLWEDYWNPGCSSSNSVYMQYPGGNNSIGSNGKILNHIIISEGNLEINGGIFENGGTASIVYSRNGNINISAAQTNFTGIIYAPNGTVTIGNQNCTINGAIISKQLKGGISDGGNITFSINSEVVGLLKKLAEGN